ncbi:hypothetical protein SAMN04488051_10129 [Alkalimonas amylolytica]|uniref:Uncharacterized protein n=2 Tax=Alkalimonas amylolytica TaxID=152573 RepID=A0A1H3WYY6_ALKAM|nr:hypothetical protein SAMN04488051_10129 [Alkalimonas amylolytica]
MISDETLSAFLDAELPEADMQQIYQQVQQQPELALRLASLCSMDACFRKMARRLDDEPLPAAVTELLQAASQDNQPQQGWWQQSYSTLQRHAAAVASLALISGMLVGYYAPAEADHWPLIASTLEQSVSGQSYTATKQLTLTPTLAFINNEQQLCRHYQQSTATATSEHLACKQGDNWQLIASAYQPAVRHSGEYQLASHQSALDSVMDQLGVQAVLTLQQEHDLQRKNN